MRPLGRAATTARRFPAAIDASVEGKRLLRIGTHPPLELWAGVECTHNRVGDRYFDQLTWNGHADRISDLDRFAALGIRTMRYPVLWERTAPHGLAHADWSWSDDRLDRLRTLGIRPIVGLVHHGSGPRTTNLCDPSFAPGLAAYAGAVAARYPWVSEYTPVNEPLTTSRFSALYGHWYPHARDSLMWARAQLNQCRATVLAMRAIRAVNPAARLVQTDDLGKTYSTPRLAYQAEFENHRRWLTFDLLCGKVDPYHPMWAYLTHIGIAPAELVWFRENPSPPDIIGINSYLASVRFLDERVERYPGEPCGGNGRDTYVDVPAARVVADVPSGPYSLLHEAWERYRRPIVVSEAHNAGPREEQLRWQAEVWDAAVRLHGEGADMRAVTVWSLLGTYHWNVLVTHDRGEYEPGVFDVSGPEPRPTAIAAMVRARATGQIYDHPVLDTPGWWRRPERFSWPSLVLGLPETAAAGAARGGRLLRLLRPGTTATRAASPSVVRLTARPILIVGAGGALGQAFARLCDARVLAHHARSRAALDITDAGAVAAALDVVRPWAVVNAAGYSRVEAAEDEPETCMVANADGAAVLAAACAARGIALLTFSSALVFGGTRDTRLRTERDAIAPRGVFATSKAEAERRVRDAHPDALIARVGMLFSPWDDAHEVARILRSLQRDQPVVVPDDVVVAASYVPPLVHVCLDLLVDGERGVWHLVNDGALTWANLARSVAGHAGHDPRMIEGRPLAACGFRAPPPRNGALGSERGMLLPPLAASLHRVVRESDAGWARVRRERRQVG